MSSTETRPPTIRAIQPTERVTVAAGDGLYVGGVAVDALAGRQVSAVASEGPVVWALVDRRQLVRVEDGVADLVASLPGPVGVVVHAHRGEVFVGGDDAGLWKLVGDELQPVVSFATAPTHTEWHTPWGGPPSVFSMASHGADLFVSVHVGGILRSGDGGDSWDATIDLHEDVHQVVVDPDTGAVWAATGTSGLARSTDGGRTWSHHIDGLHATYLLAVARTDAGVLVGASSGHAGRDGRLYLFDGRGFHRPGGLPDALDGAVGPRQLAGDGNAAAVLTPSGDLYASDDGGRSWHRAGGPYSSPAEVRILPVDAFVGAR